MQAILNVLIKLVTSFIIECMTTTDEKTIEQLLNQLHVLRWTDVAIAEELDTTSMTVGRWRRGDRKISHEKLVRAKLQEILGREE